MLTAVPRLGEHLDVLEFVQVVLVAAIVLTCIFVGISTGIFLVLSLVYTGFALYDVYQREKPPQSLTNPTY